MSEVLRRDDAVDHIEGAAHAIFMKTVIPVRAAEPAPLAAVNLLAAHLGGPALRIKQRMFIDHALPDEARVHRRWRIEGDAEQRGVGRQASRKSCLEAALLSAKNEPAGPLP